MNGTRKTTAGHYCGKSLLQGMILVLLTGILGNLVLAQGPVRQEPRPELLVGAAGNLQFDELADLSLLVSGQTPAGAAAYRERWQSLMRKAREAINGATMPPGEALLVFLHGPDGVLRKYRASQTRVDILLDEGSFNCVSSALVYYVLARGLGMAVGAVGTRDHAFCTMVEGDRKIDVETTIAYGYDPGRRQDFRDNFGRLTGFVWVPASSYSVRNDLDDRHLLELVLQNLAAEAQDRRDDLSPVGLAWDAAALIGLEDARPILASAYHNLAAGLNGRGDYPAAMSAVLHMEEKIGPSADSDNLASGIAGNMVQTALSKRQWARAHELLDTWRLRLGDSANGLAVSLFRLESQDLLRTQGWGALRDWLGAQGGDGRIPPSELAAAWEMGITQELARITRQGDWETGLVFLDALPDVQRRLPAVTSTRNVVEHNIVAAYHNRFAALANARKFDEARVVLDEAQARFPRDNLLRQDRAALDRH